MTRQPRAVREASERADAAHAAEYPEAPKDEPTTPAEPDPGTPPAEPPSEPTAPPAEPPAAPPAPEPNREFESLQARFQTLEGKYRAEVPRYASQVRELTARNQFLEQTLASMNTPDPDSKPLVTQEEVEEYGEDLVSLVRRVAQEEAGRAVKTVAPRIDAVQGQLEQTHAQTQQQRVFATLDASIENWRDINRSREFLDWLAEEVPFTDLSRKALLTDAFERNDASKVLSFFTGFVQSGKSPTRPTPPAAEPQTPPARTPQISLEKLAGPRASNGVNAPPTATGPQPWTRREISAFYAAVQKGVYKDDPEKKHQIEKSIENATRADLISP